MIATIQLFVYPDAWSEHLVWGSILVFLLTRGPGAISVDHVIAQAINPGSAGSRRPALNLLVGNGGGSRGLGYISYSASGQAIQGINNPWNAYSDFMGLGGTGGAPSDAQMRIARQQSVLDLVSDDFDDLKRAPLSAADRDKLDAHFQAIREIEMGMTGTSGMGLG